MLFYVIFGLVLLVMVVAFIATLSDGFLVALGFAGVLGVWVGSIAFIVFLFLALAINGFREVETEWGTTSEVTYTVAELSDVTVNNNFVNFFTQEGGKLDEVEIPGVDVVQTEPGEGPVTVTVSYQHRELGTAIVPWGEGEERTVVVVKN